MFIWKVHSLLLSPLQNELVESALFLHSMIYRNFSFKISDFCD